MRVRHVDKMKEKADRAKGIKRQFQLKVGLYAQAKKLNPEPSDEQERERKVDVPMRSSSSRIRKNKDLIQIWGGDLSVEATDERAIDDNKWKMIMRGTAEFKAIYPVLMTSDDFATRERNFPGYLDAIYIAAWKPTKRLADVVPIDPKVSRHQDAGKVGINFKYCHYRLDTTQPTFKDALAISSYRRNECWINAIEERYRDNLLRPGKTKNIVNRETILKLIGRTESTIKKGLTIEEILPFFERYKLKLRVYDVFYQLIFKYDPDVENRTNPAMYCVCDGNHIYLINKDINELAQKASAEDFTVSASSNFNIIDKAKEPSQHYCIESIDDIVKIITDLPDAKDETTINLIQKKDDLEQLIWELHQAGYKPNVKYSVGKLRCITLRFGNYTFVIKSQQLIDYAIDGMVQVDKADVFNRLQDAKDCSEAIIGAITRVTMLRSWMNAEPLPMSAFSINWKE